MLNLKKPLLLIAAIACVSTINMNMIEAHAADYKLSVNSDGYLEGTINKINLDNVVIEMKEDSPFMMLSDSTTEYSVITNTGEKVCEVEVIYEMDDTLSKLLKCEKSNFITKDVIYNEIEVEAIDSAKVMTYKVDSRKSIIYFNDEVAVRLSSMEFDEVLYGNNYLNKFNEHATITLQE